MMEVPERARVLKLDEPPLSGRVRYLSETDRSVIPTIRCGVLFVMAFWSVTSFRSFAHLKQTLARLDLDGLLEVVVVDTDGCPDLCHAPELLGQMHGNGEAAWISGGKVVATASCGSHPKAFETYTRYLLGECIAEPKAAADGGRDPSSS
jgi:hypothetical protein